MIVRTGLVLAVLVLVQSSVSVEQCFNDGILLANGTCKCAGFTSGDQCQTISCQRAGILDKNRCACPPGWMDLYCSLQGCRPGVEQNLDIETRSLIIVFNMKSSMQSVLDVLKANILATISSIIKPINGEQPDDWIANYIFYGYVTKGNDTRTATFIGSKAQELSDFLNNNVTLSDGDDQQPVITAVRAAQQLYPQQRPFGIVLVFTDSTASDAKPVSHRPPDQLPEISLWQTTMLWRNRISYILTLPKDTDTAGDKFDTYRRLAKFTHGDLFLTNSAELKTLLNNVIGNYYLPENVAVAYGISGNLFLQPSRDVDGETALVLLTIDTTTTATNVLPTVADSTLLANGTSFALYSTQNTNVSISSTGNSVYSYRIFIQSRNTLLINWNDDALIDVGNVPIPTGMPMMSTSLPKGQFTSLTNMSYTLYSSSLDTLIRPAQFAFLRPQLDCTYPWMFPTWESTIDCPLGPITIVYDIYLQNNLKKQRVVHGYCIDVHRDSASQVASAPEKIAEQKLTQPQNDDATYYCDSLNPDGIGDSRQLEFRTIHFLLERSKSNKPTYDTLVNQIEQLVNKTIKDSSINNRHFSLILFDDKQVDVLLSTHRTDDFVNKFKSIVSNINYVDNLNTSLALEAYWKAMKINILSPGAVFLFTSQAVTTVQNISRNWDTVPKDIQVNIVTVTESTPPELYAVPSQLGLIQRQSGGRFLPITNSSSLDFFSLIAPTIYSTALVSEDEMMYCNNSFSKDFIVEQGAKTVYLEISGQGVKEFADTKVLVFDSQHEMVTLKDKLIFSDTNLIVAALDLAALNLTSGHWGFLVQTTKGGCRFDVRHVSPYNVLLGFVSNPNDDAVASQIFSNRQVGEFLKNSYVPIRVSKGETEVDIVPSRLDLATVHTSGPLSVQDKLNLTVNSRDDNSCSYQYISSPIVIPQTPLTKWTLVALSNDKVPITLLQRVFYYYQHIPGDSSVCNENKINDYGQCSCPENYQGQYCYERQCQNGATFIYGICQCIAGFYGDFCDIPLLRASNGSTTTPAPNVSQSTGFSSTTIQSTTSLTSQLSILVPVMLLLVSRLF